MLRTLATHPYFFTFLVSCVGLLLLGISNQTMKEFFSPPRLFLFSLSSLGGIFLLIANNLILAFVALELHIIPLYLLILSKVDDAPILKCQIPNFRRGFSLLYAVWHQFDIRQFRHGIY